MKELSYHILDIANNSVRAKAKHIEIHILEDRIHDSFSFEIIDDGCGMSEEMVMSIKNPFITSRTFRKVGLGIPLLNDTCMNCNGSLRIISKVGVGTKVSAQMQLSHIDRPPMGNLTSSVVTLMTADDGIEYEYIHKVNDQEFRVTTKELADILGDVPLSTPSVVLWLKEYIDENVKELLMN